MLSDEQAPTLDIDHDTMRRRLEARTDDDWRLGHGGVELMLAPLIQLLSAQNAVMCGRRLT